MGEVRFGYGVLGVGRIGGGWWWMMTTTCLMIISYDNYVDHVSPAGLSSVFSPCMYTNFSMSRDSVVLTSLSLACPAETIWPGQWNSTFSSYAPHTLIMCASNFSNVDSLCTPFFFLFLSFVCLSLAAFSEIQSNPSKPNTSISTSQPLYPRYDIHIQFFFSHLHVYYLTFSFCCCVQTANDISFFFTLCCTISNFFFEFVFLFYVDVFECICSGLYVDGLRHSVSLKYLTFSYPQ